MTTPPLKTTRGCFGCGTENRAGLAMAPTIDADGHARAGFTARAEHRGYTKIAHGGVVAAACDEIMGFAIVPWAGPDLYVTVSIEVRFLAPVPIGLPMTVEAWCTRRRGRLLYARSRVLGPDGREHATARGTFVRLPERLRRGFLPDTPR